MIGVNARKYCTKPELIENYKEALEDLEESWVCHHRLETHNEKGERLEVDVTVEELKAKNLYYNRPPEELIFMRVIDHNRLHRKNKPGTFLGKHHTEETNKRNREAHTGRKASEETKQKMSEGRKRFYETHENPNKGKPAWNKGQKMTEEQRQKLSEAHKGHKLTPEQIKKIVEKRVGKKWFNNGVINIVAFECPEGFVPGRIKRK